MDKTVLIQRDVLDVVKRIKEIDRGYSVRYNLTRSRYEVCHIRSAGEPVLVLPYQKLDYRAVEYVRKTRLERLNEIIREITEIKKSSKERGSGASWTKRLIRRDISQCTLREG
jgi:hypothetical protein